MLRAAAALVMVIGLVAVPVREVAACDCALVELPDAVAEADVAFVGTLLGHASDEWRWSVDTSRDADTAPVIVLRAPMNDGANCGVSFGANERWLVLASVHDGVLQTNGCLPNRRVDLGADPETETIVKLFSRIERAPEATGLSVPAPLLVAVGAAAVVGLVAVVAFRRHSTGT